VLVELIKTMRPKQWLKNVFVFAPLVFDLKLGNIRYVLCTVAGYVLLCVISGCVYIVNDLVDREKDRLHPRKRKRPIARLLSLSLTLPQPTIIWAIPIRT